MLVEIIATATFAAICKGLLWIYRVATNHLPHLQAGIDDLKIGQKEQTELLKQVNQNLFIIAKK